jgi:hypothetical protein
MQFFRSNRVLFLLAGLLVFFILPVLAWAQPAPTPSPSDPNFFALLFEAITKKNWQFVAALVVIALNALLVYVDKATGDNTWLDKGFWKWGMAVLLSVLGAVGTHLLSNAPISLSSVLNAIAQGAFVGVGAAGIYTGAQKAKELREGS